VIPHTSIGFQPALTNIGDSISTRQTTLLQFGWRDVGTLIATSSTILSGTTLALRTPVPSTLLPMTAQNILLSDKNGNGVEAAATAGTSDPLTIGLSNASGPTDSSWAAMLSSLDLGAPLSVLFDLLQVSRGKTVSNEVLGSGDATITTGQEFVLQKSPLTYLQSADSTSGSGYKSTLQVWVDGVEWYEVPSFYGQVADAHIFVTREDEKNMTHVQFGGGVNGARIPTGLNNVVATYRYGSGAESPDPGSLAVILKPWPGLKAIVNPVAAGGGADPDPPQQIKKYAPQSVLTFGRAISADDYEVIAAQAPGVARARSYWSWDTAQQRMLVKVYVGDDPSALSNAKLALAGASDPNRPLNVIQAQPVGITLGLTLVVDPSYVLTDVVTAATAALVDPDLGILGTHVVQIGQSIFQSQIYQACLDVPGVTAVHSLQLIGASVQTCSDCPNCDYRFDPGEGNFFVVTTPADQIISPEVAGNGG
jgi:predicted phage baseplate assembly protein